MQNEKEENLPGQLYERPHEGSPDRGEMKKRRITMEDGRRYLIFYTFENPVSPASGEKQQSEVRAEVGAEVGAEVQENV